MKKVLLMAITIATVIVIVFYMTLSPTITPSDVSISATIRENTSENTINIHWFNHTHTVDVVINKNTQKPLRTGSYFYNIYPYIANNHIFHLEQAPGYIFGSNSVTKAAALKKLYELNMTSYSNDSYLDKTMMGFSYEKEDYPISTELYVDVKNTIKENNLAIVLSYHEKKFGKNLSWVKAFPINIK